MGCADNSNELNFLFIPFPSKIHILIYNNPREEKDKIL